MKNTSLVFMLGLFLVLVTSPLILAFDVDVDIALVVAADTGQVLFEKNAHRVVEPASITKIMTMILCQEALDRGEVSLDDMVTVSRYAQSMGGSQIFLGAGEKLSIDSLLRAIAISSANDASVALAEYLAGTEDAFVRLMNKRAKELGMENTNFMNPTGLPPTIGEHYSTAYDTALMSMEFLRHPELLNYSSIWLEYLELPGRQAMMVNFNRMIRDYPGADGIKTGHTNNAGYCISATAERDDRRFIAVIMGAESERKRNEEATLLLDFAFRAFQKDLVIKQNDLVDTLRVPSAREPEVTLLAAGTLAPYLRRGEPEPIVVEKEIYDLEAPLKKGQVVGVMKAYQGGLCLGEIDIIVSEDAPKASAMTILWRKLVTYLNGLVKRN